jgi:hypothetical protein
MSTIVTRADKDSPLTNTEVDANFTNLNTDKAETDGATLTNVDINSGTIDGVTIGGASAGAGTFTTLQANGLTVDTANPQTYLRLSGASNNNPDTNFAGIEFYNTDGSGKGPNVAAFIEARGVDSFGTGGNLVFATSPAGTVPEGERAIQRLRISDIGDLSLYDDSGTSQNFYWDASTSRLGIRRTAPIYDVDIVGAVNTNANLSIGHQDRTTTGRNETFLRMGISSRASDGVNRYSRYDLKMASINDYSSATLTLKYRNDGVDQPDVLSIRPSGDIAFFAQDGTTSDFYWDKSTSRLGLGTTSPDAVVHVFKQINYSGTNFEDNLHFLIDNGTVTNHTAVLMFNSSGTDVSNKKSGITGGNYFSNKHGLAFFGDMSGKDRSANPDAFIDSSGNVGIGTTSPETMLHLSSSSGSIIRLEDQDASAENNSLIGALEFYSLESENVGEGVKAAVRGYNSSTNGNGELRFYTGNTTSNDNEVMRIDSSGNLLVGTTVEFGNGGITLNNAGLLYVDRGGNKAAVFSRRTSDGAIVEFSKDFSTVGLIGVKSNNLTIGTLDTGIRFIAGVDTIIPVNPTTGVDADATINLGSASARFKDLYLSGGVYLGGTGAANLLDDYEEGAWTPTLAFGGASTGITYTSRDGHYIKIGKQVTLHGSIILSSKGSSTGAATVESLPFTVGDNLSGTTLEAGGIVSYSEDFTGTIAVGGNSVSATDGTTQLKLKELQQTTTQTSDLADSHFQNTTSFRFSITYFT